MSTTSPAVRPSKHFSIVIVGGGAAGLATAASILQRKPDIDIAIVEPRQTHNYQPGWTMVGGRVFHRAQTHRPMAKLIPKGAQWLCASVSQFKPDANIVELNDGTFLSYWVPIVAPGIRLKWDLIDGLQETLGKNGVTSNYLSETAPETWELTRTLREGTALFTQPPLPIKCAGAPQKAMYLSCDHWRRTGALPNNDVSFHNAGDVLFGVKDYVPALMGYVERYGIDLAFNSNLIAVDGAGRRATFKTPQGEVRAVSTCCMSARRRRPLPSLLTARFPAKTVSSMSIARPFGMCAMKTYSDWRRMRNAKRENRRGSPQAGAYRRGQRTLLPERGEMQRQLMTAMAPAR